MGRRDALGTWLTPEKKSVKALMMRQRVTLLVFCFFAFTLLRSFAAVTTLEIYVGQSISLASYTVEAGIMKASSAKWKSSDTAVVIVNSSGQITGLSTGEAYVSATLVEGSGIKEAKVRIVVKSAVASVKIPESGKVIPLAVGEKKSLSYAVTLKDPSVKSFKEGVTWTSVDPATVSVDGNGLVTGIKPGRIMVYVTTNDGQQRDYVYFDVVATVKGLKAVKPEMTMKVGEKLQYDVVVSPETAVLKTCTYVSSEPSVVAIDSNGILYAKAEGISYITATTVDGGFTASSKVEVKSMVKGVLLSAKELSLTDLNKSIQLTAELIPLNASEPPIEKGIIWTSGDPRILSVSSNGFLTAQGTGITYAQATTVDGGHIAAVYVQTSIMSPQTNFAAQSMKVLDVPKDMVVGKKYPIPYQLLPANTTDQLVYGKVLAGRCLFETVKGTVYVTPLSSGRIFINLYHSSGINQNLDFTVAPSITSVDLFDSNNAVKDKQLMLYLGQKTEVRLAYNGGTGLEEDVLSKIPVEWTVQGNVTIERDLKDQRHVTLKMSNAGGGTLVAKSQAENLSYTLVVNSEYMVKDILIPSLAKLGLGDKYKVQADFVLKDNLKYGLNQAQEQGLNLAVEASYVTRSFIDQEIAYEDEFLAQLSKQQTATSDEDLQKRLRDQYSAHLIRRETFRLWLQGASGDYVQVLNSGMLTDRDLVVIPHFVIINGEISSPLAGRAVLSVTSKDGLIAKKMTIETSDEVKELILLDASGNIVSISNTNAIAEMEKRKKELEAEAEANRVAALRAKLPKMAESEYPSAGNLAVVVKAYEKGLIPAALSKKYSSGITRQEAAQLLILAYEKISAKKTKKIPTDYYLDTKNEYVNKVYALGIVGSLGNRKFMPSNVMNVAETSNWIANMIKATKTKVPVAVMNELINWGKTGKGTVTKEAFIVWIMKFIEAKGL